ncbi:PorT family protein [bacterium]|nr:PorT family protein [bacterium]
MKKIFCVCLFFLFWNSLSAQKGVRVGFRAGYSMATQYGIHAPDIPYTVDVFYRHGLVGGLMIAYPITESFCMQQEFLYVQKGSREDIALKDRPIYTHTEYDLNYFEIPIVMRYAFARLGSFTFYGCSGYALSILLNGEYRLNGVAEIDGIPMQFTDTNKIEGVDIFDYGFLYGAGVEFRLLDKPCFFEYRFTIGWNTLNMPTAEGEDPAPLRNQDYIFTLGLYL